MLSSKCLIWLIIGSAAMVVSLAGCGGGGSSTPPDVTTGSLSGHIEDFTSGNSLQGIVIKVGSYQAQTDTNGDFLITGIPAGTYPLEIIPGAASHLVLPPGNTPGTVTIYPGAATALPAPVLLMDENDLPPPPPTK